MMPFLAALALLIQPQEKSWEQKIEDLNKAIEGLKKQVMELQVDKQKLVKENEFLRKEIEGLRGLTDEVIRLREALKSGGGVLPPKDPESGDPKPPTPGPIDVIRAKVWAVDAQFAFVVINKGEPDGVLPGYRFDIMRKVRVKNEDPTKPDDWRYEKLGTAEFEKYVGQSKAQTKLKILEGRAQDMKYEDEAIAHRKIAGPGVPDGSKPTAPSPGEKKFSITGKAGDGYVISYGSVQGAKQTDRVFVYRDNRLRAELRLDTVEKDFSIGRFIANTGGAGDFGIGDDVQLKKLKLAIVGRVRRNDEKTGIFIEAGLRQGVKAEMLFEVRRQGRVIGTVKVKKPLTDASEVECVPPLKREDVFLDDFVESIE